MRVKVNNITGDGKAQVELLEDEIIDDVEQFTQFGFDSRPESGIGIITNNLNSTDETVLISANLDAPKKPSLENNEVSIYTNDNVYIHLKKNDSILIKIKNTEFELKDDSVVIKSDDFEFDGDVLITGKLTVEKDVKLEAKLEIMDDVNFLGDLVVLGKLTVTDSVIFLGSLLVGAVNFLTHTHSYITPATPGPPGSTGTPT